MLPSTILPGGSWIRRKTDIAMMLLPQPLSPTTPNVAPGMSFRLTPSRARTVAFSRKKYVFRFWMSRTGC